MKLSPGHLTKTLIFTAFLCACLGWILPFFSAYPRFTALETGLFLLNESETTLQALAIFFFLIASSLGFLSLLGLLGQLKAPVFLGILSALSSILALLLYLGFSFKLTFLGYLALSATLLNPLGWLLRFLGRHRAPPH